MFSYLHSNTIWAVSNEKISSIMRKMHRLLPRMRKVSSGICAPLIHSIVSNDFVNGQQRPWSDCADAQAYLGRRCPHIPEDTFSHLVLALQ